MPQQKNSQLNFSIQGEKRKVQAPERMPREINTKAGMPWCRGTNRFKAFFLKKATEGSKQISGRAFQTVAE